MSIGGVARSGLFLFVGSVVTAVLAYAYWFLILILSGRQAVGIASSIYSLSLLVSWFATLGVPIGVQRFLGRDFGHRNIKSLRTHFWSSFVFTAMFCLLSAVFIWVVALLGVTIWQFDNTMLILAGFMILLSFSGMFDAFFTSTLKTQYWAVAYIISSIVKVVFGVFLVYMGFGWFGAVIGILLGNLALITLMMIFTSRQLKRLGSAEVRLSSKALRESVRAGFPSWLPQLMALVGQQLGILAVSGIQGFAEGGTYYVSYAIFGILAMLPTSFLSILFPLLSGSDDTSRGMEWKVLKLSLAIACPFGIFLAFYSSFPLSFLGAGFTDAASTLSLLALSVIPLTIISAITSFVYAKGCYGKVLGIGLATNIPRVALYFYFVPIYSGFGAALTFLLGSITGLVAAVIVSKATRFQASIWKITATIAVPLAVAMLDFFLRLDWFIGGMIIFLVSVLAYGRLGVIERSDLSDIALAFASKEKVARTGERLRWLLRILYGEQKT